MNEPQVRVVARTAFREEKRRAPTHCRMPECGTATTHRKPYCLRHVDQHRYVRKILDRLQAKRDELARVAWHGRRQVDVLGIVARDILAHVHGRRGLRGHHHLARALGLSARVARAYERALVEAGLMERELVGRHHRLQVLPPGLALLSRTGPPNWSCWVVAAEPGPRTPAGARRLHGRDATAKRAGPRP